MLSALALGYVLGVGSIVAAASIRRALVPAQKRDQECLQRFAERDRGGHD